MKSAGEWQEDLAGETSIESIRAIQTDALAKITAIVKNLREYTREQARVADKNYKEWLTQPGGEQNAEYRNGMWYAYFDIENRLPLMETV